MEKEEKKRRQLGCLKYHLSEAIEEKEFAEERVKGIREEIKKLTQTNKK